MPPTPWGPARPEDYARLPLRAHAILADVPVHDVWRVRLGEGDHAWSMLQIRAIALGLADSAPLGIGVRTLFSLRRWLGALMGWDREGRSASGAPLLAQLEPADREASLVPPGTRDGPFMVVYVHGSEAVSGVRNATVEAYLVWALHTTPTGQEVLWAIHVRPVGAWTRPYMALIDPFRRYLVYPALLRAFHEACAKSAAIAKE